MSAKLERVRRLLDERGVDAALIAHPANRFYVSGFTAEDHAPDESAGVLLVTVDRALLFTSPNNVEWAAADAPAFEVIGWKRPWVETVVEHIRELGCRRVGFEDHALVHATVIAFTQSLDGAVELLPLGRAATELRAIKEPEEIAALERVIQLTDDVFREVAAEIRVGMTERAVAWRIEQAFREHGADGAAFPTIVASGPHAARPHHHVSERAIQPGEPIIIDMGARLDGYNADLTRTVWLGEPIDRLAAVYNVVYGAQAAALAAIRAGVTGAEVDSAARAIAEAAGYGEHIVHGLGHGLGIQVHEAPRAAPTADRPLRAGEVLTVEPGLYFAGWGGVRIEDVVVIEEGGCRVLTTAPKQPLTTEAHS